MSDMRVGLPVTTLTVLLATAAVHLQSGRHLNPVVDLLSSHKAVFGVYGPRNPRVRPGAAAPSDTVRQKSPSELARESLGYTNADFLFDGSMEGEYDRAYPIFAEFAKGVAEGGMVSKGANARFHHPLFVKMHEIAPDPAKAVTDIGKQLDLGVNGVVFVGVESPEEVTTGLAAMRFKSKGGTRSDAVGSAPAYWGMSEKEYKEKADVWPLNPKGELVNFTIVESKAGLARVREIAAVKGIGVLFPGAGYPPRGIHHHRRERSACVRRERLGGRDSAGARGVQGIQCPVRVPGDGHRHRGPHATGLQRVHHQLG
jgi:hypothetical protein